MNNSIHEMCHYGDLGGVVRAIEGGQNIESFDEYGQNCLHLACSGRHLGIAAELVKAGADVNAVEQRDSSLECLMPIHIAVLRRDEGLVSLLVRAGANVSLLTRGATGGYSALHLAASSKMARLLIKSGADVNTRDLMEGKTPLMHALEISMLDVAKTLVSAGADVHIADDNDVSPLQAVNTSIRCDQWVTRATSILVGARDV